MSEVDYEKMLTKKQVIIEMYNKTLRKEVSNAIKNGDVTYLTTDDVFLNNIALPALLKKSSTSKQQVIWLTITKSNSCTVESFIKLLKTLPSFRLTQEMPKYCFESTGLENGEFKNIHCHYLCMKQVGINKQQYLKRLEKILKDSIFNINIQIYESSFYKDKIDYMLGKKDQDQKDKPEITKMFREEYRIDDLY